MNSLKMPHAIWPNIDIEEKITTTQLPSNWFIKKLGHIKTKYFYMGEPILEVKTERRISLSTFVRIKSPLGIYHLIPVHTHYSEKLTRKALSAIVKRNSRIIEALKLENVECLRASYLLNDRKSKYVEETFTIGKGKNKRTEIRGFVQWHQTFTDEKTGEKYKIQRHKHVKTNGEWI